MSILWKIYCYHLKLQTKHVHDNVQDNVHDNVHDIAEKNVIVKKRDARHGKIIEMVHEDAAITINKLAEILKVSSKTIQRDLETLRTQKRIERIGSDTDGRWVITPTQYQ